MERKQSKRDFMEDRKEMRVEENKRKRKGKQDKRKGKEKVERISDKGKTKKMRRNEIEKEGITND